MRRWVGLSMLVVGCAGLHLVLAQLQEVEGSETSAGGQLQRVAAGRELFAQVCSGCHGLHGGGGSGPSLLQGRQVQQQRRLTDQELFDLIKKGVPGTMMPPFPLPDEKIWQLAAFVRSLNQPAIESPVSGDRQAGQAIFSGKGACSSCHMIGGEGGFLGPDLSNIGIRRTLSQLREALLEPNVQVTKGFQGVTVTSPDGRKIKGVAKNYDNYSIQILDVEGKLHLLRRKDPQKVLFHESSWMPDDYARRLSTEEIEDLMTFLSRQSIRPVSQEQER